MIISGHVGAGCGIVSMQRLEALEQLAIGAKALAGRSEELSQLVASALERVQVPCTPRELTCISSEIQSVKKKQGANIMGPNKRILC